MLGNQYEEHAFAYSNTVDDTVGFPCLTLRAMVILAKASSTSLEIYPILLRLVSYPLLKLPTHNGSF